VQFSSTGTGVGGSAVALDSSGNKALSGNVSGSINGTNVDFTIRWDSGPQGHYTGTVGADGFAHGTTNDEAHPGSSAKWDGTVPLGCASTPEAPQAAPPPAQAATPPEAPHDAIALDIQLTASQAIVTITNKSSVAGTCTYDAVPTNSLLPLPEVHQKGIKVGANFQGILTGLKPPPPGVTYHAEASCTGKFNGQDIVLGTDSKDVTG
jgi:hypothetical protein